MIRTPRLKLIPATAAALRAELEGTEALARALGASVPASWPPDLYDADAIRWTLERLETAPPGTEAFWVHYFVLHRAVEPVLIGVGGFKGPPEQGRIELGYSIVATHRRRGFATEAVEGMLGFAFSHPGVDEVVAETLPELAPSIGVLQKAGFRLVGDGSEAGVVRYAIARSSWEEVA